MTGSHSETNAPDCFGAHQINLVVPAMSSSDTIIELDGFRRIRDALALMRRASDSDRDAPKVVDWYLPGFVGSARVTTTFGDLPIEALRLRDDLRTYSGANARVQMVDKIHLDDEFIRTRQDALPIRIPANSFGLGKPMRDISVSPGQEICPDAHVASTFMPAREMRGRFNVDTTHSAGLSYYRFHCGEPTIVRVEGIWVRVQP